MRSRAAHRGFRWGIVQRQDPGFWCQLRGFESLCPSHREEQPGGHMASGLSCPSSGSVPSTGAQAYPAATATVRWGGGEEKGRKERVHIRGQGVLGPHVAHRDLSDGGPIRIIPADAIETSSFAIPRDGATGLQTGLRASCVAALLDALLLWPVASDDRRHSPYAASAARRGPVRAGAP